MLEKILPASLIVLFVTIGNANTPQNRISPVRGSKYDSANKNQVDVCMTKKVSTSPGLSITQGIKTWRDYQSNGGDERHLWILPDGTVHAIYFGQTSDWRGTFYAYSSDNGNSFSNPKRVESYTADFPSMDITSNGRAVIASHVLSENWSHDSDGIIVNIDAASGTGQFSQIETPLAPIGILWPRIAAPSDSLLVYWGSPYWEQWEDRRENYWNTCNPLTNVFGHAENERLFPGVKGEIRGTITKSAGGNVAVVLYHYAYFTGWYGSWLQLENDFGEGNIIMRELNVGSTSFQPPVNITNYVIDTTRVNVAFGSCISALYSNENLHIVWTEVELQPELYCKQEDFRIVHWSKNVNGGIPTEAVRWDPNLFGTVEGYGDSPSQGIKTGWNHNAICNPTIGMDAAGILTIVFTGFSGDSASADPVTGYAYGDIWAVSSLDGGLTWGEPINLTNSPDIDDRYPYISTWNEAGKINVLYQTDTRAGSSFDADDNGEQLGEKARGDIDHLFLKADHPPLTTVREKRAIPAAYCLNQNYPNPFNPATTIEFSLPKSVVATLEVVNTLGQAVAILASKEFGEGSHTYTWDAADFPSGIYFYRLTAGDFSQTRKMLLVR